MVVFDFRLVKSFGQNNKFVNYLVILWFYFDGIVKMMRNNGTTTVWTGRTFGLQAIDVWIRVVCFFHTAQHHSATTVMDHYQWDYKRTPFSQLTHTSNSCNSMQLTQPNTTQTLDNLRNSSLAMQLDATCYLRQELFTLWCATIGQGPLLFAFPFSPTRIVSQGSPLRYQWNLEQQKSKCKKRFANFTVIMIFTGSLDLLRQLTMLSSLTTSNTRFTSFSAAQMSLLFKWGWAKQD